MSRMLRFWRRIRYSSRSSGPSKASRNTSSACGGMYRSRGSSEIGSPFTTANGISTCSGGGSGGGGTGGVPETIRSSGRFTVSTPSARPQMHGVAHVIERLAGRRARFVGAFADDVAYQLGIVLELLGAPSHATHLLDDALDERLLAIEAADARGAAALIHPAARRIIGVDLVQVPHRA